MIKYKVIFKKLVEMIVVRLSYHQDYRLWSTVANMIDTGL